MFANVLSALSIGFLKTLEIFGLTLVGAIPLGLLICLGAMTRIRVVKYVIRFLVWVIRGTPLMLQLLVIYYGPGLIIGDNWWGSGEHGRFIATIVAFIINYACYFSEIFRGGIQSIPVGQQEAGFVLGLTKAQIFFRITLLQVVKRIVPPMSNEIITLVKDTSLSRIIALQELIWAGQSFMKSAGIIWPLFFTGIYYLAFSGILTVVFNRIEKKLEFFRV
ncbi:MAG: amino acid ABC transporter permease [Parasporobacterium sp.]|nr:amino acid ABC transporter permease [Parasporobacterium sp.]